MGGSLIHMASRKVPAMSKLTLEVSDEMNEVLAEMASMRHVPKTQVLRRAVGLMRFLDEAIANNEEIVLRDKTTMHERRLVLESQL
jgi:hypothetical protein